MFRRFAVPQEAQHEAKEEGESRVRCESVETTGFQLEQTVLPVGSRNTEVMDRASQDSERFPLQSEVGRVSAETLHATHSAAALKDPCRATCTQALEQTAHQEITQNWCSKTNCMHHLYYTHANRCVSLKTSFS